MNRDGRGRKPTITEKQKVAALLGYAMTNYPLPLLAEKLGMRYGMLVKFLYVDMGVENKQKHRWTADDNRKIKAFYKEGEKRTLHELAEEIGVAYTCLQARIRNMRKVGLI